MPDGLPTDAVYYVGANILSLEKRFAFRPADFRLWIAIHEVTHRAQFTGVPWMREYFLGLVREALELVDPDPRTMLRAVSSAVDEVRAGRNPLDEGGLVGLFASPEQRGVLGQVQALMSVLEGHGNVVMDDLGREHVAGPGAHVAGALAAAQDRRHHRRAAQAARASSRRCASTRSASSSCAACTRSAAGARSTRCGDAPGEPADASPELSEPARWLARVDAARV